MASRHACKQGRSEKTTNKQSPPTSAEQVLLSELTVKTRRGTRRLKKSERDALIQMLAVKAEPEEFDIRSLIPRGSFLERIARHFDDTDISYALPIMHVVMTAASYLTQNGAIPPKANRKVARDYDKHA